MPKLTIAAPGTLHGMQLVLNGCVILHLGCRWEVCPSGAMETMVMGKIWVLGPLPLA